MTSRNVPTRGPDGAGLSAGDAVEPGEDAGGGNVAVGRALGRGLGGGEGGGWRVGPAGAVGWDALGVPPAMGCMGAIVLVATLAQARQVSARAIRTVVSRTPRSMVSKSPGQGAGLGLGDPGTGSVAASAPKTAASSNVAK